MRKIEPSSGRPSFKIILFLTLLLAYPVIVHLAVAGDNRMLAVGYLLGLAAIGLVAAVRAGSRSWSLSLGVLLAGGLAYAWQGEGVDLVFLPPLLINLALFTLFGRTLLAGKTPLITRLAMVMRGYIDEELSRYTHRVTVAWTLFFAFLAAESVVLALFAPLHVWSLFANFLNYLLVLLFLIVEYHVRIRCLTDYPHPSFLSFCRAVIQTDFRSLAR